MRKRKNSGSQFRYKDGETHYQKHKQYYIDRNRERKTLLFEFITNYKKTHSCVDCNNSDFRVLEFDHVTDDKEIDVSKAVRDGWSIKRIQLEIDKCEVRCANCHRVVTWERKQ